MAIELPVHRLGVCTAGSSLTAKQFYLVDVTDDFEADLVAVAGQGGIGVLQNAPDADEPADVMILGVSKVKVGGTIEAGQPFTSDATGKAVAGHGADRMVGRLLEAAVSGDIASAELLPGGGFCEHAPSVVAFKLTLASVADGIVARMTPGFAGRIKKAFFVTDAPVTTGSKLSTLTPKIAGTATTGGVVALTSLNCTPQGAEVDGTAITALNLFGATDEITLVASSTTTFVEGSGTLFLVLA
jgi:hypothetical protein